MLPLPDAVAEAIDKIQNFEASLSEEPRKKLFQLRRRLQQHYHDHLKQGTRIKVTKSLVLECPHCQAAMMDSDHLYLHLRQKHNVSEKDAGEQSTAATRQHADDVLQLGSLLGQYTEVLLEDEFSHTDRG